MGNDAPEDRCELVVFQCAELYIYKVFVACCQVDVLLIEAHS